MSHPDCSHLAFKNTVDFKKWYCSYEWRAYSLDKTEAECSALAYYLHAAIMSTSLSVHWPIRSKKSESPDFIIQFGSQVSVGLEHSTITSEKYQRFRSEGLKNPTPDVIMLDSFKLGGAPTREVNQGWVGEEPEREWADLAIPQIMKKIGKLNKLHFQKCHRNELVLNTVSYLPNLEMKSAIPLLGESSNRSLSKSEFLYSFDSISLIYGSRTYLHVLARH